MMASDSVVQVFIDPNPNLLLSDAERRLFDFIGVEAYSWIYLSQIQERQQEEDEAWNAIKPLRDGEVEEIDDSVDLGPEEPDTYGEEYVDAWYM